MPITLDLGCGKKKHKHSIGLDMIPLSGVDIVCDLSKKIPIRTGSVDIVCTHHFLEHLDDIRPITEEIHRVLKPGGYVIAVVPYYASSKAYQHPEHKIFFTYRTFEFFTQEHECSYYSKVKFQLIERKLFYQGEHVITKIFGKFVGAIANKYPDAYERFLANILPCIEMRVVMRKC